MRSAHVLACAGTGCLPALQESGKLHRALPWSASIVTLVTASIVTASLPCLAMINPCARPGINQGCRPVADYFTWQTPSHYLSDCRSACQHMQGSMACKLVQLCWFPEHASCMVLTMQAPS